MPKSKLFAIWSEGYQATGESCGATYHGEAEGVDFADAVKNYVDSGVDPQFNKYVDLEQMTHWGCRLFDNHGDASASFG